MRSEPTAAGLGNVESAGQVIAATRTWLEKAVIGLKLCPFAAHPYLNDRLRYCVSAQRSSVLLREELAEELRSLIAADPLICETTLLIHPLALLDFCDYNEFLGECDEVLAELGIVDEMQVASFHPRYQFAGTAEQDIENHTNRSPYPMLHLLREASVTRAVASFPAIHDIGSNNIRTMRHLGHEGWERLWMADDE